MSEKKAKRPRQWNSTLPIPEKRLQRSSSRSSGTKTGMMRRQSKPIPKVNPERQAKRRKSYAQKLAAYKRSETYKLVEQRAGGMCEHTAPFKAFGHKLTWRCNNRRDDGFRLTHHHKTYARFGGAELPEDMALLCDQHNAEAESQHPTRNRNYSRSQGGDSR